MAIQTVSQSVYRKHGLTNARRESALQCSIRNQVQFPTGADDMELSGQCYSAEFDGIGYHVSS